MKAIVKTDAPSFSDMRIRYVPGVRIRHSLLGMVPWVDLALIVLYLVLLHTRIVLQPGVVVELPAGPSSPGLYSPLTAVVVLTGSSRAPVAKVFFDNENYVLDDARRMESLEAAMAARRLQRDATSLTLYADRRVEARHLMQLMQMAQESGIQRINLGTQPADGRP
jgi:biopolymer transport protein ExbD